MRVRPVRRCVGCGRVRDKAELLRFTAMSGKLVRDAPPPGKGREGRGAYLCPNASCVARVVKKHGVFSRALKTDVLVPDADKLIELVVGIETNIKE